MPYGRCVTYSYRGDRQQLIERARAGLLPIFKQTPGFIAYGVILEGDHAVSMSAWNSESDAQAADQAAKDWVAQNADMTVVTASSATLPGWSSPTADLMTAAAIVLPKCRRPTSQSCSGPARGRRGWPWRSSSSRLPRTAGAR